MFELSISEQDNLRLQIAASSRGGARYNSFAFTEYGVLILSNILKSAIAISIKIIDIFVILSQIILSNTEIYLKQEKLEKRLIHHESFIKKQDGEIEIILNSFKNEK
jgi:hypothetical protein